MQKKWSSTATVTGLTSQSISMPKDRVQESQLAFTLCHWLTTFPTTNHTGFVLLMYINTLPECAVHPKPPPETIT